MSITSVTYKNPGGRTSSINALWQRTYGLNFRVETSSPNVPAIAVRNAVDPVTTLAIPSPGTPYHFWGLSGGVYSVDIEHDLGSFAQTISVTEDADGSGRSWTVAVDYGIYDASLFGSDPTLWPIKCTFGGQKYDRIIYYDQAGNPILNSAGDPFTDPFTEDDLWSTLTVERNELVSTFGLSFASTYSNKLNDATWNTFAAKTVKSGIITTTQPQYDSNGKVYYLGVTYPFEINPDGWARKVVDRGFFQIVSGARRLILDANGQKFDDPPLLNGSGAALAVGGTPVTLTFDTKQTIDYTGFGLDLSLRLGH